MVRRVTTTMVLLGGCIGCLALAFGADPPSDRGTPAGSFKPVASIHGLMTGQGLVFKTLQQSLHGPKNPDRPRAVQLTAEALAELANVNILNGEKDDYRAWATQLRDTSLELAAEAKKKTEADDAKMKALLTKVEATCNACHDAYQ